MSLYEDLGVSKDADKETIKRAYRKRVHKAHPDKGGNPQEFHAIQKAYDVLGDDARRAHYDAHGTDGQLDRQGMLMQRLAALMMQLIEQGDPDRVDIVTRMREQLDAGRAHTQDEIRKQEARIVKYERTKKRLKKKGSGENLLAQMLDGQIGAVRRGIEMGKSEISNIGDMLKILDNYSCAASQQTPSVTGNYASFMFGSPFT